MSKTPSMWAAMQSSADKYRTFRADVAATAKQYKGLVDALCEEFQVNIGQGCIQVYSQIGDGLLEARVTWLVLQHRPNLFIGKEEILDMGDGLTIVRVTVGKKKEITA